MSLQDVKEVESVEVTDNDEIEQAIAVAETANQEVEVTEEESKVSKIKGFAKKHWKAIAGGVAIGAATIAAKIALSKHDDSDEDDGEFIEGDYEESVEPEEVEETESDDTEAE